MTKKFYDVPVQWKLFSTMQIEAESEQDAIQLAHKAPLPVGMYLEDSFEIFEEEVEPCEFQNKEKLIKKEIYNYIDDMQNNIYEIRKIIDKNPELNLNFSDYIDYINDIIYKY